MSSVPSTGYVTILVGMNGATTTTCYYYGPEAGFGPILYNAHLNNRSIFLGGDPNVFYGLSFGTIETR